MSSTSPQRPDASEYAPYFAGYISLVPEGDIIALLADQLADALALIGSIPEHQGGARYAPGKWSIKEVLGHILDAERVFAYRALRFARGDRTPLPGFEQDAYVQSAQFDRRSLGDLGAELEQVRRASILFFRSLDDAAWLRRGVASGNELSVRALAYIIAGHAMHHVRVLRERYL